MNELDLELSKKSKIIEVAWVKKELRLFKVREISGKSEILVKSICRKFSGIFEAKFPKTSVTDLRVTDGYDTLS